MDSAAVSSLRELLAAANYTGALDLLAKHIGERFVHPDLAYARVFCLLKLQRWEEAVQVIDNIPGEHRDAFAVYKSMALYEMHKISQANKLLFMRKDTSSLYLALKSQVAYEEQDYSQAKSAIVGLCKKEKNDDANYNNEVISAADSTLRFTGRTSELKTFNEIFTNAIGFFVREKYSSVVDTIVNNISALDEATSEEKSRAYALAFVAIACDPALKDRELPFTKEDVGDDTAAQIAMLSLEGKGMDESEIKKAVKDGKIMKGEANMAIIYSRSRSLSLIEKEKIGEAYFALWPFCTSLPQIQREHVATLIAEHCTHNQLKSMLDHPELCTIAAVERARAFGDERLALNLMAFAARKQQLGQLPTQDAIIDNAKKVITNMHVAKTRIREAKTGHQGADADNTTRASKIKPAPKTQQQQQQIHKKKAQQLSQPQKGARSQQKNKPKKGKK